MTSRYPIPCSCRRARATRLRAEERDAADRLSRAKRWHLIMEPAFDWVTGEIDVSPLNPEWEPELRRGVLQSAHWWERTAEAKLTRLSPG